MTDFEDRLRAAMNASVASRQPPPGLAEVVRRRRRRHNTWVAVTAAAVVLAAAAAIPPARSAMLGGAAGAANSPPAGPGSFGHGQHYGCAAQTLGALGPDWRQGAAHAGPVWMISSGIAPGFRFARPDGSLSAVPLIVLVRDSTSAWVTPQVPGDQSFRFLPGFNTTNKYTLRDGAANATFTSCSSKAAMFGSGLTEYYIGVIVTGPGCIPIDVRTSATGTPVRAILKFGRCTSGK